MRITTDEYPGKELINHSYERLIRFIFNNIDQPKNIFEFGPGYSTCLMSELSPNSVIYTYESSPLWYIEAIKKFGDNSNIKIIKTHLTDIDMKTVPNGTSTDESKKMLEKNIKELNINPEIIFIDGADRKYTYELCLSILNPDIIIFHDSQWYFKIDNIPPLLQIDDIKKSWKYYIHDNNKFNRNYNVNCVTLALSNIYNFNKWYKNDLDVGLIDMYNEK